MLAWLLALVFRDGKVDTPAKKLIVGLVIAAIVLGTACGIIYAVTDG